MLLTNKHFFLFSSLVTMARISTGIIVMKPSTRAMALCLILMTGRLGAMAGSNLIAYLLSINCNLIFILFGGLLLGKITINVAAFIPALFFN